MDPGGLTETSHIDYIDSENDIQLHEEAVSSAGGNGASHTGDVCQTMGFVKLKADASSVRFCVEPVAEGVIKHLMSAETPSSDNVFNYCEENLSVDDVVNGYGSNQLTVRSVASIGLGSSDGRKIHLRRVHTTGADSIFAPLMAGGESPTVPSPWPYPMKMTAEGNMMEYSASLNGDDFDSDEDDDYDRGIQHRSKGSRRRLGQVWNSRLEFLLACVGFAAGLGNIWRFPSMVHRSGGGAFLIPYCIMVFLCGIPLQTMEMAVGQYTREGPVEAMRNICPLFSGVGVSMVLLSLLLSSYYSVVMSWAMLYLVFSFNTELPWTHCDNSWNTQYCRQGSDLISPSNLTLSTGFQNEFETVNDVQSTSLLNDVDVDNVDITNITNTIWRTPGQEFFDFRILQMTSSVEDMGDVQWELAICLFIAWVMLYATVRKSVRWSGKAVYVTATLPYLLLLALIARALTLEGADDGLRYFFHPDWSLLLKAEVWVNALAQTFMSMGIAYGSLVAFASYNQFQSPFLRDAFCLSALNSMTSLVAGIIVFAAMGHSSLVYQLPIQQSAPDGLSLALVMYSTVVSRMPFPQFWAVLLFVTFIFLGLDTQFATVEVILLTLQRFFKQLCNLQGRFVPDLVVIGLCSVCFIGGIPYITQGGIYLMHMVDYYVATIGVILLAFTVGIATGVLYGAVRLARNVREMTAHSPSPILVLCWAGVTPILIMGVLIFHLMDWQVLTFNHGSYVFPDWTSTLGWIVLSFLLVAIPILAIVTLYQASGKTIFQKIANATKSQIEECPCCRRGIHGLVDTHSEMNLHTSLKVPSFAFAEFAAVAAAYPPPSMHSQPSHIADDDHNSG